VSVLTMAVPTFLIGVLPDHAQIGVTAAVLLVALRLVQGVSVGGENPTSVVFLVEGAAPDRRGWMGSWSFFGSVAGILLGSAVGALTSTVFPTAAFETWGWRVPFLLGLGVGLMGLYLRRHLRQLPTVHGLKPLPVSPVAEALRTQWRIDLHLSKAGTGPRRTPHLKIELTDPGIGGVREQRNLRQHRATNPGSCSVRHHPLGQFTRAEESFCQSTAP
jgi:MFS family permease